MADHSTSGPRKSHQRHLAAGPATIEVNHLGLSNKNVAQSAPFTSSKHTRSSLSSSKCQLVASKRVKWAKLTKHRNNQTNGNLASKNNNHTVGPQCRRREQTRGRVCMRVGRSRAKVSAHSSRPNERPLIKKRAGGQLASRPFIITWLCWPTARLRDAASIRRKRAGKGGERFAARRHTGSVRLCESIILLFVVRVVVLRLLLLSPRAGSLETAAKLLECSGPAQAQHERAHPSGRLIAASARAFAAATEFRERARVNNNNDYQTRTITGHHYGQSGRPNLVS